jgi:UDP-N-acetyl-D-mannosaminuronate dehydrogenase
MTKTGKFLVVGLGEIGKPLLEVISNRHEAVGIDIAPPDETVGEIEIMHVCYPFKIHDFIGETSRYIALYNPRLTIIHSTVAVGTTRAIAERTGTVVVNSPVRGKHARMAVDLLRYDKFIGALDSVSAEKAAQHFKSVGMNTRVLSSPEATELAKLTETTYFGLIIAWAQEVERYCDQLGLNYDEVVSIYEEVPFFPAVKYFPGVIGGHCVMSNIDILASLTSSDILKAIESSNAQKIGREAVTSEQHSKPVVSTTHSPMEKSCHASGKDATVPAR